ncbi:AGE family epimerase/isomerase [Acetobacteraceae bacterium KSS8]|uniref:AGE family epimerase/isomerase n=1 Tax=Endosaccharibacter trunci TaxID=2812733 RepID=A0ABT1WBD9_9PROT|nr:AGE family epimerase/isomerase [Acetobacteraceae bacterium KSS8]
MRDTYQNGALARFASWLTETVLPFWLAAAHDPSRGHFHEGLSLDGSPLGSVTLRTRTAARMIHAYADAAALGLGPPGGLAAAERAAEALERDARLPDGGYVRAFDRTAGAVLDPVRDLYDQSCVLLAQAALLQATGNPIYRERADALLETIERVLPGSDGGWAEDENHTLPRRQNPHMHMFEALALLAGTTGDAGHLALLERCHDLLHRQFLRDGLLIEFFGPHWQCGAEWRSERLDPGHMAEWAFLLHAGRTLLGRDDAAASEMLMRTALELGCSARDPLFLIDEVDRTGQPLSDGRRLWLQIEQIKGCLVTGRGARAVAVADALLREYIGAAPSGLWTDRFSLEGTPIAATVPASSCYHAWTLVGFFFRNASPAS